MTTSRDARNQYLNDQLNMYNELVDKLEKALGLTTDSDQQAAHTVNQAVGGGTVAGTPSPASYDYRVNKSDAARWEATELQGYPAVAFSLRGFNHNVTGTCSVSVGIRDDLVFGVGLTLSDNARQRGVDSCQGAEDVANTVLTNLKSKS